MGKELKEPGVGEKILMILFITAAIGIINALLLTMMLITPYEVVWAMTSDEIFSELQFSMTPPGARAIGLGASFIGLADDASTAVTNPAGLCLLIKPELAAEICYRKYRNTYAAKAVNLKVRRGELDDSVFSPSFLSFVCPWRGFSFAFSRHEVVNYESSFESAGDTTTNNINTGLEMLIEDYSFSGACKIGNFFLGLSIKISSLDLSSDTTRVNNIDGSVDSFTSLDDSDTALGLNVGLLWKPIEKLSCGLVYKPGSKFSVKAARYNKEPIPSHWEEDFSVKVPDSYGLGICYNLLEYFTLTSDIVYITYSDLGKEFRDKQGDVSYQYKVDDGIEFHLGGEYVLMTDIPLALRAGLYTDPDHQIQYTGEDEEHWFLGGDDIVHYTFGVGVVINPDVQIDAAYNYSERYHLFSLSGIYQF